MISELERARLNKLLGMLTSDFDGERATAAAMIARMAKQHKMTVPQLCGAPVSRPDSTTQHQRRRREPETEVLSMLKIVIDTALDDMTEWEQGFAIEVSERYTDDTELSEKQIAVIRRMFAKADLLRRRRHQQSA